MAIISIWHRVGSYLEQLLDDCDAQVEYLGKGLGFDGWIYHKLHRLLRNYQPDIVHTHLHVLRYALPSLLALKPGVSLHTVHNLAEREIEPRARCIQSFALKHGVVPVAVSKEVALSLEALYRIPNCRVIANGIPTHQFASPRVTRWEWRAREGFRNGQILFVCVARLDPQKNHALLLKAFAEGPASHPDAHLVLVGEGPLRNQLTEQVKNLGLDRRIHFLGLRTDIPDVLGAMDVFVLSSDWEGNPLSIMEAMTAGVPIVSTAVGGVSDLVANGKEGLLVKAGDAQGFADSMNTLLNNRETRRSMAIAAVQRARENFDVSTMVQKYEQLYEQLLDPSHRLMTAGLHVLQDMPLLEAGRAI